MIIFLPSKEVALVPYYSVNERVKEVLLLPEKLDSTPGSLSKELKITNVSARYPNQKCVSLQDLNFELKEGQLLGVLGPVGAGKSSLFSLLLREVR